MCRIRKCFSVRRRRTTAIQLSAESQCDDAEPESVAVLEWPDWRCKSPHTHWGICARPMVNWPADFRPWACDLQISVLAAGGRYQTSSLSRDSRRSRNWRCWLISFCTPRAGHPAAQEGHQRFVRKRCGPLGGLRHFENYAIPRRRCGCGKHGPRSMDHGFDSPATNNRLCLNDGTYSAGIAGGYGNVQALCDNGVWIVLDRQ